MAVAICVDVGPGIACPSDMSSMKRCSSSHFFFPSTNVLRKRPMCACGPPNAMNPIGKNAMVTSSRRAPYVSAVASTPLSTGAPAAWLLPAGSACTATAGSASVATSTALGVTAAVAAIETQGETRTPLIGSKYNKVTREASLLCYLLLLPGNSPTETLMGTDRPPHPWMSVG
eukprot:scaffold6969_cov122-Isochrysis_galbana.AAC.5